MADLSSPGCESASNKKFLSPLEIFQQDRCRCTDGTGVLDSLRKSSFVGGGWLYTARLAKPAPYRLWDSSDPNHQVGRFIRCPLQRPCRAAAARPCSYSSSLRTGDVGPVCPVRMRVRAQHIHAHPSATRAGTGKSFPSTIPSVLPHRLCCWEPIMGDSNISVPFWPYLSYCDRLTPLGRESGT